MLVSKEGFGDMKITFSWCAAAEALAWRLIYAMKKCWHYKLKGQRTVHVHNDSRMMTVLQYLWFTKKCIILDRRETWETCPCSFLVSILGPLQFFFFFLLFKTLLRQHGANWPQGPHAEAYRKRVTLWYLSVPYIVKPLLIVTMCQCLHIEIINL